MKMREIIDTVREGLEMLGETSKVRSHRLFHASPDDVTQFAPLTHFGTEEAARSRASNAKYQGRSMKLYVVDFTAGNPVRIKDLSAQKGATHSWIKITDMLHYTVRKISAAERDAIYAAAAPFGKNTAEGERALIETLQTHGWDAIVYRNSFEDAGQDSWINLTSEQVRIVEVMQL